jgi:hypothetical protein
VLVCCFREITPRGCGAIASISKPYPVATHRLLRKIRNLHEEARASRFGSSVPIPGKGGKVRNRRLGDEVEFYN